MDFTGAQFKEEVKRAFSDNKLTREEFEKLHEKFAHLNPLAMYAVSTWMSGEYPGLEGCLRGNSWDNWVAANGEGR